MVQYLEVPSPALRCVLLFLAVLQQSCAMPVLPARYDPFAVKEMGERPANQPDSDRCAKVKAGHGGASKMDIKILESLILHPQEQLQSTVKMLCVAYTYDKDHSTKGLAVASTWLKRCDGALVLSNESDPKIPTVAIPHDGPEAYKNIWQKTRSNWKYIHDNYLNDYDYFVFGGTDYYVIVENLRYYLESEEMVAANSEQPLYLGRRFAEGGNVGKQFNSGGPSYILNQKALRLFVDNIETQNCRPGLVGPWEDVMIANCLKVSGNVIPYDTRDSENRERFHPFMPGAMFNHRIENVTLLKEQGRQPGWFTKYSPWGLKVGTDSHSPDSIAWHYIKPKFMRAMDDLLYGCRAFRGPSSKGLQHGIPGRTAIADAKQRMAARQAARET